MIRVMKRLLSEKFKLKIKLLTVSSKNPFWIEKIKKDKKNIFVFLGGFYQNLGDMAITYAQVECLKQAYPDANIIAIPSTKTYEAIKTLKNYISKEDIITTIGGGNMGDMYQSLEDARLYVVKSFPDNKVISFPQTIDFNNSKSLNSSKRIYQNHKNLTIFARENNSFIRAKQYFQKVDIKECPDIVLSLNKIEPICERTDIICCLRADKEQNLTNSERQEIIDKIKNIFPDAQFTDTVDVALKDCTPERYSQTLENFWNRLRKSKVVITDRLHCMIFCAITGTPCVVFDNSNKKISGVYNQWMSELSYIKLFDNDQKDIAISVAQELYNTNFNIKSFDLSEKFSELNDAILK